MRARTRGAMASAGTALALAAALPLASTTAAFVDPATVATAFSAAEPEARVFGEVETGVEHSIALSETGEVWAWGRNAEGQAGQPPAQTTITRPAKVELPGRIVDVDAGRWVSIALDDGGHVYTWGHAQVTPGGAVPTRVAGLPQNIAGVSAGGLYFLAWTTDGALYSWGDNGSGRLGRGVPNVTDATPALVTAAGVGTGVVGADAGRFGGVAWKAAATVYAWGESQGLASGVTLGGVPGGSIRQVEQANDTKLLLTAAGTLHYSIGTGGFQAQQGISGVATVSASAADTHDSETFAARTSDGALYAWWDNSSGQVGDGTSGHIEYPRRVTLAWLGSPRIADVSAGDTHSIALTEDGRLLSTGANDYGQLGTGTQTPSLWYAETLPALGWP